MFSLKRNIEDAPMLNLIRPNIVPKLSDLYKDIMGVDHACLSCLCSMYILGFRSVSQTVANLDRAPSCSRMSKAVGKYKGGEVSDLPVLNRFSRRLSRRVLRKLSQHPHEDLAVVVDDTGLARAGANHPGQGRWADSKHNIQTGQRVVLIGVMLRSTKEVLPLAYWVRRKRDEAEYVEPHRAVGDILEWLVAQGLPSVPVLFDSWFASAELLNRIRDLGLHFVTQLQSSRKLILESGEECSASQKGAPESKHRIVCMRGARRHSRYLSADDVIIKNANLICRVVKCFNHRKDKSPFAVWAATDLSLTATKIWELSRARWSIEVFFRNLKQNLSFGVCPSQSGNGTDISISLPLAIAELLTTPEPAPSNHPKTTLGRKVAEQRGEVEATSIMQLVAKGLEDNEILVERYLNWVAGRKPVSKISERKRSGDMLGKSAQMTA